MSAKKRYESIDLKPYSVIMVTKRKVSDNVQPEVRLNEKYAVVATDTLASGCPVAIVQNPAKKGKTMRINADRFCWREVHAEEVISEVRKINKQQDVDETIEKLKKHFSDDEVNRMIFIPYCIEFMALEYLQKCLDYARDNRLSCFVKVGRLAKEVLEKVRGDKLGELGKEAYRDLHNNALAFMEENNLHFVRMWFSVNSELKRIQAPERDIEMVTDAVCGIVMMDVLNQFHEERAAKVLPVMGSRVFCSYEKRKKVLRDMLLTYASLINGKTTEPLNLDAETLRLSRQIIINELGKVTFLDKMRNRND